MDPTTEAPAPVPAPPPARGWLERHALWIALGAVLAAGAVVYVGVQVAPETFYDHFWWEDIWGPLTVDAHQCKTDVGCPGVSAPGGVRAKDGYTVTSELTYGAVLAAMLYGIYVGLFRRYRIKADAWFVLGLLPWIVLGPTGRVLEDANVFCGAGTIPCADPSPVAFFFISPVIYIAIAVFVMASMMLGLWVERSSVALARRAGAVGAVLAAGVALFALLDLRDAGHFAILPPLWFVALAASASFGLFWWRAKRAATMNLTVFTLGLPFALMSAYLVAWWLAGNVWSNDAWTGRTFRFAGAFIVALAALTAALVWVLARVLHAYGVGARWSRAVARVSDKARSTLGWVGILALAGGALAAGVLPAFQPDVPNRATLVPLLLLGGLVLLALYALVEVGKGLVARPAGLLVFAAGLNVALVFGHAMDGLATWVALEDPFGFGIPQYSEKHPFSEFLLRYWNGFLFPAAKLAMVLVVAWVLDKDAGDETKLDERNLVGLVKMAIFVLGFAPGLRDVLRLAMGV